MISFFKSFIYKENKRNTLRLYNSWQQAKKTMIKNLISDLVHKTISLSEALTRAKLISLEIDNDTFRDWLKRELEGYNYDDKDLPTYRQIYSPLYLEVVVRNGQTMTYQVFAPEDVSKEERQILETHRELGPITTIEKLIDDLTGSTARMNIPNKLHQTLYQFLTTQEKAQIKIYQARLSNCYREVNKIQLSNVIEMTKQKLIDTLAEFHKQFPTLMDDFKPNKVESEKLQNIVTTNIYGGTNPMNVAVGENITQSDIVFNITTEQKEQLKEFGIEEEQIAELETINNENPKGSESRKTKIFGWLGKVSASLASRGIYDSIPELTEFIGSIV